MTAADPYEVLGVPRNATPDQVRKAKRKKAMEHHPDRNGDKTAFELVLWAADLLLDPEKRKRYDETGQADERGRGTEPSQEDQVTMVLAGAFQAAVTSLAASGVDPTKVDLVQMMRSDVEKQRDGIEGQRKGLEAGVKALRKVLGRFRRKRNAKEGVAADLFERLTRQRLAETERAMANVEKGLEVFKAALDQLCRIEFEHEAADLMKPNPSTMGGGVFFQWRQA